MISPILLKSIPKECMIQTFSDDVAKYNSVISVYRDNSMKNKQICKKKKMVVQVT